MHTTLKTILSIIIIKAYSVSAYEPLSGKDNPLISGISSGTSGNITELFNNLYKVSIGIAIGLAILFIIVGGIQYMTTDAMYDKGEGKKKISGAFIGLLVALSSFIILNTINPDILKTELKFDRLGSKSGTIAGDLGNDAGLGTIAPGGVGGASNLQLSQFRTSATAYSPQDKGHEVEGGYPSSIEGLDGKRLVRTLDDYAAGESAYVTLAGDPSQYKKTYVIPEITYKTKDGQQKTLTNVIGYVHDTGSAFVGTGNRRFDIPVGKDYPPAELGSQPFSGKNITFVAK